jgi:hypothetical protein
MDEVSPSSILSPDVFKRMCFELVVKGHDCLSIASSLGSTPDSVAEALNLYLAQRSKTESDPRIVSARLDYYLLQLAPSIELGQAWAINQALKIEALRIQLFGLSKLPPSQQPTQFVINGVSISDLT